MSSTEAIPCCCGGKKQYLCCLEVTATATCIKGSADEANCSVSSGGEPETRTVTAKIRACAASEEECSKISPSSDIWCSDGTACNGGEGGLGNSPTITGVSSVFYPGVECTGDEADEKCTSNKDSLPCQALACGPCGPYFAGCADSPCPPVPDCPKKPCCIPDQPKLCCFTTIDGGCIVSQSCEACNGATSSGTGTNGVLVAEVPDCSQCSSSSPQPKWVSTTCCTSCDTYPEKCPTGGVCCYDCVTFQGGLATCDLQRCVTPCGEQQTTTPICSCPLASSGGPCPPGILGPNYGQGAFNSPETRYTSGFVQTSSGSYELNTLLLFGYGYNNL